MEVGCYFGLEETGQLKFKRTEVADMELVSTAAPPSKNNSQQQLLFNNAGKVNGKDVKEMNEQLQALPRFQNGPNGTVHGDVVSVPFGVTINTPHVLAHQPGTLNQNWAESLRGQNNLAGQTDIESQVGDCIALQIPSTYMVKDMNLKLMKDSTGNQKSTSIDLEISPIQNCATATNMADAVTIPVGIPENTATIRGTWPNGISKYIAATKRIQVSGLNNVQINRRSGQNIEDCKEIMDSVLCDFNKDVEANYFSILQGLEYGDLENEGSRVGWKGSLSDSAYPDKNTSSPLLSLPQSSSWLDFQQVDMG
ncbi:unnamed protein product [Dovyalis caffra]|uniref:Uncharacterized protein n=1 Tax=Dovyalis caffra TaxID=77055 RepID=A0AAV1QR23_9ROSI|nr:unnamed protein product [Dovyalis caffra]